MTPQNAAYFKQNKIYDANAIKEVTKEATKGQPSQDMER
jgi:hypothetical protein